MIFSGNVGIYVYIYIYMYVYIYIHMYIYIYICIYVCRKLTRTPRLTQWPGDAGLWHESGFGKSSGHPLPTPRTAAMRAVVSANRSRLIAGQRRTGSPSFAPN